MQFSMREALGNFIRPLSLPIYQGAKKQNSVQKHMYVEEMAESGTARNESTG